ncbi:TLP18.3, Psb32 and MOLO-1 founding protein of phosphatase [Pseudoxanthomonas sp. GM95]|uniref:TPM domain-containing protein n=1 Tax=Pseudoxanthomonas sp. GM95 TaxID=1881043 RepID=UPI0008BECEE7|nr:TPM domain-containing protein [Pseudoxanthomonas sp. GM95]SEL73304.1 TLP18.3, Psb32 and MOLO-1 founding protein of phosphatase [Pseudoxanthomonas sp. GM95]
MRWFRHLFAPSAHRLFPPESLQRIAAAIAEGERLHSGEVMFAVEPGLELGALRQGVDARRAAQAAFARLRTWDTAANNGVLIYLLLADHRIEIVADRGLEGQVLPQEWQSVCAQIESGMREGRFEAAVIAGVRAASALLARAFPATPGDAGENELPDLPHILG